MLKRRMGDSSARSNTFRLRALESRVGKPKGAGAVRGNRGSVESSKHFQNITSKYVSEFGNRHNAFLDSLGSGKGFSYSVAVASAFVQKLNASKVVEENNLGKTIVNLADKLGVDRAIALAHQASNMYQAFNRYAQVNSSIDTQGMFPHAPALIVETVILNYVNKVSDQIVPEVTMTSMNQRIVFLDATYGTAYNDVKEGQKLVEYVGRFGATELREIPFADARIVKTNNTTITATLLSNEFSGNLPIVPNTIMFVVKGLVVGRDNGVGGVLNAEGNSLLSVKSGTVDYKTGATTVNFRCIWDT